MSIKNPTTAELNSRLTFNLEQQVRERHQQLRQFIRRRVRNDADADDLVQATYMEAWRNAHRFQGLSRPDVWLFGIALNMVRNHIKRECSRNRMEIALMAEMHCQDSTCDDPGRITGNRQILGRVQNGYQKLPDEMREVVRLVVSAGQGYQEVAEKVGVPTGTIRSRLSRAREKLRACAEI